MRCQCCGCGHGRGRCSENKNLSVAARNYLETHLGSYPRYLRLLDWAQGSAPPHEASPKGSRSRSAGKSPVNFVSNKSSQTGYGSYFLSCTRSPIHFRPFRLTDPGALGAPAWAWTRKSCVPALDTVTQVSQQLEILGFGGLGMDWTTCNWQRWTSSVVLSLHQSLISQMSSPGCKQR
jgi:hypothetical protein